jgi:hypothetical protein
MYGYGEHIEITPEQLLQKIPQEQIFEFILKEPFNFKARYISPFRESDKHPDCRFEQREDGTIIFVDFGEQFKIHRSCFSMVMDKFGVDLDGAIRVICEEFNLSTNTADYTPTERKTYTKEQGTKTIIAYDKQPYNKSDIYLWSQFLIRPEHLIEDNTFSVKRFSIKKPGSYKIITPYNHCYAMDFIDSVKIYQPNNAKYKWITNCDENVIGNINNLPATGEELIVQKSYKDHRVLRNLDIGLLVCWFMNEGCVPAKHILENLISRFKLLTFFYDNDPEGIKAAIKLVKACNGIREGCSRYVHLPVDCGYKDPAQYIGKEGRKDTENTIKKILAYGKIKNDNL